LACSPLFAVLVMTLQSSKSTIHPLSTFLMANDIVDHFKAVRLFSSEGKLAPGMSVQGPVADVA
jgi:hypothetical protein